MHVEFIILTSFHKYLFEQHLGANMLLRTILRLT